MGINPKKIGLLLIESAEELLILGIIILSFMDFFGEINPDLDLIKKSISWCALAYLLYRASLSEIFFGTKKKFADIMIIISYFFLSFKNILSHAGSSIHEFSSKGIEYWSVLHPINSQSVSQGSAVHNIGTSLQNINLNTISNIPLNEGGANIARTVSMSLEMPPQINNVYLNVTNDLSNSLFFVDPKFLVHRWYNLIIDNSFILQKYTLIIGFSMLFILAIYFTLRTRISSPSLMQIIEEEGEPPSTAKGFMIRLLIVFFVLNFFFLAVFNLIMEWLGIALKTPIIVTAAFFYLLIWLKHHKKFSAESIIYRIGNFGEGFYKAFINLFHDRKGLLLGLSGMLVLHLLTDIGNFLLPYITGHYNPIYFAELGQGHDPIFSFGSIVGGSYSHLTSDLGGVNNILNIINLLIIYSLNVLGIFMLFFGPGFIWYVLFKDKRFNISKVMIGLFFSSLVCFLMIPLFKIGRILSKNIVGVDIKTQSALATAAYPLFSVVIISIGIGVLMYLLSQSERFKPKLISFSIFIILFYFGKYVFFFFIDTSKYYIESIVENLKGNEYFIGIYLFIFLGLTILFYVGGFIAYIYEIFKN